MKTDKRAGTRPSSLPFQVNTFAGAFACAALVAPLIGGCGGGGSPPLEGEWLGTGLTDDFRSVHVIIEGAGSIESITIDGVNKNVRGEIEPVPGERGLYSYELDDGTIGGIVLDPSGDYAVLADDYVFAVLQKGAASMPIYEQSDLGFVFEGASVDVDHDWELQSVMDSNVSVFVSGAFRGDDSDGTSFQNQEGDGLSLYDNQQGVWHGYYESSGPSGSTNGQVYLFMSADKDFLGAFSYEDGGFYPGDCRFFAWRKE